MSDEQKTIIKRLVAALLAACIALFGLQGIDADRTAEELTDGIGAAIDLYDAAAQPVTK